MFSYEFLIDSFLPYLFAVLEPLRKWHQQVPILHGRATRMSPEFRDCHGCLIVDHILLFNAYYLHRNLIIWLCCLRLRCSCWCQLGHSRTNIRRHWRIHDFESFMILLSQKSLYKCFILEKCQIKFSLILTFIFFHILCLIYFVL